MIASAAGAEVVAVDIREGALDLAREVGATRVVNGDAEDDVAGAVRDLTHGGAHVSLDAVGSSETCFNSVACLRKRGRHVQVGLMVGEDRHADLPLDRVVADELELRGTHGIPAHRYPALLEMVRAHSLAPAMLVQDTLALKDAGEALTQLATSQTPGIQVVDTFR